MPRTTKKPEIKEESSSESDGDSVDSTKRKRDPEENLSPEELRRLKKLKKIKKKRKREKKAKREKKRIKMMKQAFSKEGPTLDEIIRDTNRKKREKKSAKNPEREIRDDYRGKQTKQEEAPVSDDDSFSC